MARYINVNELLNNLPDDLPYKASVKRVLIQAPTCDVVPKSEVEKIEKESSAFAEIIHKQEDEIQQLRKSLLTKQALEEEFSKSVKKIEKQALKTIENAKQEVAREIFEEIEEDCLDFPMKETDIHLIVDKERYDELKKKYAAQNTNNFDSRQTVEENKKKYAKEG